MEEAILQMGKFICGVTDVAISCAQDTVKKYKEFNAQMNEVHKLIKESHHIRCPCEILSFEEMVDTEFMIPITKNDTPASIAEVIVKGLERRY